MHIEGTYTLQASPETIWQCLMDQEILRQTIPGIEGLERLDNNTYELALHLQQAPFKGSYRGHISIVEPQYPYHYHITIQGEGRHNTINGTGSIHLSKQDNNSIITYRGTLTLGKMATLLPPTLVKGATKLFIQGFFTALAAHIPGSAVNSPESNTVVRIEERRWQKRIQRIGIISVLLFLVWVGTRLPRRR